MHFLLALLLVAFEKEVVDLLEVLRCPALGGDRSVVVLNSPCQTWQRAAAEPTGSSSACAQLASLIDNSKWGNGNSAITLQQYEIMTE